MLRHGGKVVSSPAAIISSLTSRRNKRYYGMADYFVACDIYVSVQPRCFGGWGKQVAPTAYGTNDRRAGRIGFDLAADAHDAQVDGTVESLGIAGICQFQQSVARENPLRIGGEDLEQAVFRGRE